MIDEDKFYAAFEKHQEWKKKLEEIELKHDEYVKELMKAGKK